MLKIAFKEWAVICRALADGKQALILRKGGIAEAGGEFHPEHNRFWLYPTYLHEHKAGLKPAAAQLFDRVAAERPPARNVRFTHFAEVAGVYSVRRWELLPAINAMHLWSESMVRAKFDYRRPQLFVLPVRIFSIPRPIDQAETEAYAGCRTWVELEHELPTAGAAPVLDDRTFGGFLDDLDRRLNPRMFA
jgi:hypothetical protein